MSPKSRGRKRRRNSKRPTARGRSNRSSSQRGQARSTASYPGGAGSPGGSYANSISTDAADQLLDILLAEGSDLLAEDDPLGAQLAAADLLASGDYQLGFDPALDPDGSGPEAFFTDTVLTDVLLPPLEKRADERSLAYLLALASVAAEPAAGAAYQASERLRAAGIGEPSWAQDLRKPLTVTRCLRMHDDADTGSVLLCECARGVWKHALIIAVDHTDCHAAEDVWVVDHRNADDVIDLVADNAVETGVPLQTDDLDPAEFRWQAERAIHARAVHDAGSRLWAMRPDEEELPFAAEFPLQPELAFDPDAPSDADPFSDPDGYSAIDPDQDEYDSGYRRMARMVMAHLPLLPASSKGPGRHTDALSPEAAAPAPEALTDVSAMAEPGQQDERIASVTAIRRSEKRTARTYRIKVGLQQAKPPIWRRLEVPGDIRLDRLHRVIQIAFDWDDDHLHVFETPFGMFGRPGLGLDSTEESDTTLDQVARDVGSTIHYVYDFGDNWDHVIRVEAIEQTDASTVLPRCTGGRRAAPPEDCGGIWRYEYLVDAMSDPSHPDHDDLRDWLYLDDTEDFDPAHFDRHAVTEQLRASRM